MSNSLSVSLCPSLALSLSLSLSLYIYIYPNPNTLEPDGLQRDRPAASVIAQQYSSSHCAFISARKNSAVFSNVNI